MIFLFLMNVLIIPMNLNDIAVLNINGLDYCCIINEISKNEAVNWRQKADFKKRRELSYTNSLFSNIKMVKEVLTFDDTEIEKE